MLPRTIDLTPPNPVVVNVAGSGTIYQATSEALDVSELEALDLQVVIIDSPPGVTFTFGLSTGLSRESESGWVEAPASLFDFEAVVGASAERSVGRRFQKGLLRFVRWRFTFSAAGGTITFYIRGLGRRSAGPSR